MELEKPKIVIRHNLSLNDLPEELPQNQVDALYKSLLADKSSIVLRNQLISCHMRMAWRVAYVFKKRLTISKGLAVDDLFQSAFYGLVQACEWIVEGRTTQDTITPYLATTVRRFVSDHIEHDHCVPVERRALKKYYTQIGAPYLREMFDHSTVTPVIEAGIVMTETIAMFPEKEQRVIHMMLAGRDQKYMSDELEISRRQLCEIIKNLRERSVRLRIFGAWIDTLAKEQE